MCRAHAIGWDVKSKIGTLFTLLDTVKRQKDFKKLKTCSEKCCI